MARRTSRTRRKRPASPWADEPRQAKQFCGFDPDAQFAVPAAAYLHAIQRYTAAEISSRVTQDVLLLAGSEDHYVPLAQFYTQIAALTNTRSLTARLFTRAESAQNHCQAGNFGLALQVITAWLDSQAARP